MTFARLCIHEAIDERGESARTWLGRDDDDVVLAGPDDREVAIPEAILVGVMQRYARPLADDVTIGGASFELPSGGRITLLRHLARFDVIARDWLVLELPGREPIAELATAIAAPLQRLVSLADRPDEGTQR